MPAQWKPTLNNLRKLHAKLPDRSRDRSDIATMVRRLEDDHDLTLQQQATARRIERAISEAST